MSDAATAIGRQQGTAFAEPERFHPVIFLYHRVTDVTLDPQLLTVTPKHFAEQLEVIREVARPMSLAEFVHALEQSDLPPNAVVITFDDGYADNLEEAVPLLQKADVPATVFAVSDAIGGDHEFWWDDLERMTFESSHRPSAVTIEIGDETLRWELGEVDAAHTNRPEWNVLHRVDPTVRHRMYRELFAKLKPIPTPRRGRVLNELRAQLGAADAARDSHRVLSESQLKKLAAGGLMEVGAHTRSHPVLSTLSITEQRAEIVAGKRRLEEITGSSIDSFSYPFGTRSDYTRETMAIVRDAGFSSACANHTRSLSWSDRFRLPRFIVRDWDGDAFARQLRKACHVE